MPKSATSQIQSGYPKFANSFWGTLSTRWISDSLGDGWSKGEVLNTLRAEDSGLLLGPPPFLNTGHTFFTIGTYWTQELHPKEASKVKIKSSHRYNPHWTGDCFFGRTLTEVLACL